MEIWKILLFLFFFPFFSRNEPILSRNAPENYKTTSMTRVVFFTNSYDKCQTCLKFKNNIWSNLIPVFLERYRARYKFEPQIDFIEVNCDVDKKICMKEFIRSVPSIKMFNNNNNDIFYNHDESITTNKLVDFLLKFLSYTNYGFLNVHLQRNLNMEFRQRLPKNIYLVMIGGPKTRFTEIKNFMLILEDNFMLSSLDSEDNMIKTNYVSCGDFLFRSIYKSLNDDSNYFCTKSMARTFPTYLLFYQRYLVEVYERILNSNELKSIILNAKAKYPTGLLKNYKETPFINDYFEFTDKYNFTLVLFFNENSHVFGSKIGDFENLSLFLTRIYLDLNLAKFSCSEAYNTICDTYSILDSASLIYSIHYMTEFEVIIDPLSIREIVDKLNRIQAKTT